MSGQSGPYDAVVIGGGLFVHPNTWDGADARHCPLGPGGYVAAIKAAQLGLRVGVSLYVQAFSNTPPFFTRADGMHRKAGCPRWDLSERRMYSFQGNVEQLAYLPPDATRFEEEGH